LTRVKGVFLKSLTLLALIRKPTKGPILIIDDDIDDQELIREALVDMEVKNELLIFANGQLVVDYLSTTDKEKPFLILSDVNMPLMNGIQLREHISKNASLSAKDVPFVFLTTTAVEKDVMKAFRELTVQGFFEKGNDFVEFRKTVKRIVEYWIDCKHP
jgi:CheY-like chemotaxis protein